MDPTTISGVARRFPLLGRPRPACPALADRVTEVVEAAAAASRSPDGMSEAAHALNKAALIASDCGLPELARQWCWRHINVYRQLDSLTVTQAAYLLEPVLNLARLQIRARDGEPALQLLRAMHQAVTTGSPLVVDDRSMPPLTNLTGTREDLQQLHQWTWLQYLSEGIRILALAGRWDDAVTHATTLKGIGLHLMDGRQATVIARCLHGDFDTARVVLNDSTITEPWEQQVAACLTVLCAEPSLAAVAVDEMVDRFLGQEPIPGYAVFRARLGLTVASLTNLHDGPRAQHVLRQTATEAVAAGDGYAAREVLNHCSRFQTHGLPRGELTRIVASAALGTRTLPAAALRALTRAVNGAEQVLTTPTGTNTKVLAEPGA